jgi:hypothetical protein
MARSKTAKPTAKQLNRHWRDRAILFGVTSFIFLVIIITLFVAVIVPNAQAADRKNRIIGVYDSLNLGDDYGLGFSQILDQKTPYPAAMGSGRTYASQREYTRGLTVDETMTELRTKAEKAGFKYMRTDGEGSASPTMHLKNADGTWLIIDVSSKPRDDAIRDQYIIGGPDLDTNNNEAYKAAIALDFQAAPSYAWILVNLDDDNV